MKMVNFELFSFKKYRCDWFLTILEFGWNDRALLSITCDEDGYFLGLFWSIPRKVKNETT